MFLVAKPLASTKVVRKSKSKVRVYHQLAYIVSIMGFSIADMGFAGSMIDDSSIPATKITWEHNRSHWHSQSNTTLYPMILPFADYRITLRKLMRMHIEAK
jgi:hypothetical protein